MTQPRPLARWRTALVQAAGLTLAARSRSTLEALESARLEYRTLQCAEATDVRSLRRAAQRVHDLEQSCAVLAREVQPQQ